MKQRGQVTNRGQLLLSYDNNLGALWCLHITAVTITRWQKNAHKMLTAGVPPPSKQTCWKHIFNLKCCVDHAALFNYKLFSFFTPQNPKTTKMINPWTIPSIEPLQNTQHIMTLVGWTFYWLMWAKVFRKALDIQSRFWKPYFASVWRGTIASINTAKSSGWPTHNDSRVSIWN